jgi:putative ABC transport system permease protein
MIENYLKTALRNMLRHKVHTLVNILGLTIGIGTSILVLRYVQNELSFDGWHSKLDRIYRVVVEINTGGQTRYHRHSSGPLAAALRHDLPEVEASARVWGRQWADVEANGNKLRMGVCAADPEMFSILDFPFVVGSLETAFADPLSIAMTESAARRLFGEADPIGKTVAVTSTNHGGERTVAALLKDLPANSTLQFDYVSTSVTAPVTWEQWTGSDGHRSVMTHVLLREDADPKALEAKLQSVIDRYHAPEVAEITSYKLQPLSRVYLHMRHDYGIDRWGDIDQVYQFSAIALLVMAIACINFTNLSIARSAGRAQEVGLRKVTGAHRGQLASQFLCESVLATLFSLGLALVAIEFALPEFNAIFNRQLELNFLSDGFLSIGVLSITLCVGLIAGIYPALVLTSFQPTETIKGTFRGGSHGQWLRKGLVVAQFAISIGLIVGSGVIYRQFDYIRNAKLGFNVDQMVLMPLFVMDQFLLTKDDVKLADRYVTIKQAFLDHPDALEATGYRQPIGRNGGIMRSVIPEGHDGQEWRMEVDDDYIDVFRIEVAAGRKFDASAFPSDSSSAFVLNETAVKQLGWDVNAPAGIADSPIGKTFAWVDAERDIQGSVIGVVKDFHYRTMKRTIGPLAMVFRTKQFYNLGVRVRPEGMDAALAHFEKTWKQFLPDVPFQYSLWDQEFERVYRQELRVQTLSLTASSIAILLACMGLFGLASHATEERRKEIGVRKTLGATVTSVIALVSREFAAMIIIAALVAVPVAYTIMRSWLDNFAYRTDLGPEAFIFGSALTLVVAQLTVTYHAWRAARTDPVLALRDE